MAKTKPSLASRWASETDVQSRLAKAKTNRAEQKKLLGSLSSKIEKRRGEVERSLSDLSQVERTQMVGRATSGFRGEVLRSSRDVRTAFVKQAGENTDWKKSVETHYRSPMQMLTRETIGSERRSLILEQLKYAGPAELQSFAELAAAKMDLEMGAAVCSKLAELPARDRPVSGNEIAEALVGKKFLTIANALKEIEQLSDEVLLEEREFESGRADGRGRISLGLKKRADARIEDDQDDDNDDSQAEDRITKGLKARRASETQGDDA